MATGDYKFLKVNSGSTFDEVTFLPTNGSIMGFDANLNPINLPSPYAGLTTGALVKKTAGGFGDSVVTEYSSKIGIGLTEPTARFEIKGTGSDANTKSILIKNSSSSPLFVVNDAGKAAIGTDDPVDYLHIKFDDSNAGITLENTRSSSTRRVRFDLKTTNGLSPGAYFRFLKRGDSYEVTQTVWDGGYNNNEGRWAQILIFNYRTRILTIGGNPAPAFGVFDYENIRFGLNTTSPRCTLDVIGTINGQAFEVGSDAGVDMSTGTPKSMVVKKGIVTSVTSVTPIADGTHDLSQYRYIQTSGGIITALLEDN